MEQRISLITLGVRDLAAARRFYEAPGWTSTSKVEDVVFFNYAGAKVLTVTVSPFGVRVHDERTVERLPERDRTQRDQGVAVVREAQSHAPGHRASPLGLPFECVELRQTAGGKASEMIRQAPEWPWNGGCELPDRCCQELI